MKKNLNYPTYEQVLKESSSLTEPRLSRPQKQEFMMVQVVTNIRNTPKDKYHHAYFEALIRSWSLDRLRNDMISQIFFDQEKLNHFF